MTWGALLFVLWASLADAATSAGQPVNTTVQAGSLYIESYAFSVRICLTGWCMDVIDKSSAVNVSAGPGGLRYAVWAGKYFPVYEGYIFREGKPDFPVVVQSVGNWSQSAPDVVSVQFLTSEHPVSFEFSRFTSESFSISAAIPSLSGSYSLEPTNLKFPEVALAFRSPSKEDFFGFGQRMDGPVNKRGTHTYSWSEDGAWDFFEPPEGSFRIPKADATYTPVPFLISTRGYGIFLETSYRTNFDLARADPDVWSVAVESHNFTLTFFGGGSAAEVLHRFCKYRGLTKIPPKFAFGPWKQMSSVLPNTSDLQLAEIMLERDIPTTVRQGYVHFFPDGGQVNHTDDLKAECAKFHALGLKTTCYFNPFVSTAYPAAYNYLAEKGYFVQNLTGHPFRFIYKGGFNFFYVSAIDFMNPGAVQWYIEQVQSSVDLGFDGFMLDYGEYTPINSKVFDGSDGLKSHNAYLDNYQHTVFTALTSGMDPESPYAPEQIPFARAGYSNAGLWTWTKWTGDSTSDWSDASGLPAQIKACLSAGLSGIPFCGSDVGGYVCLLHPALSPQLLTRWWQMGCFSGLMRDETEGSLCGNPNTRSQIFSTNETARIWRKFSKLRTSLFPYIYSAAHDVRTNALPLMRHHVLAFPNDEHAVTQSYQYLFGPSILAAPVVVENATNQTVWLPAGADWIDVSSVAAYDEKDGRWRIGRAPIITGGQSVTVEAPLDVAPFFVLAGTILPALDPSVYTLNAATDPRVVTLLDRQNVLHLWTFPDSKGNARGLLWDGTEFSLAAGNSSATASVVLGPSNVMDTFIWQISSAQAPSAVQARNGTAIQQASSWENLVSIPAQKSLWAWDPVQRTLWITLANLTVVEIIP